jgi:hypothetical protein
LPAIGCGFLCHGLPRPVTRIETMPADQRGRDPTVPLDSSEANAVKWATFHVPAMELPAT